MLFFLLGLLCLSRARCTTTTSDYYVQGYDCSSKDYVWNISTATTDFFYTNSDQIERKDAEYQLIQETQDDAVEIHELKVTRTLIINQCGSANSAWNW